MAADPKSRTAATVRAIGHKASGGHSLLTPRPLRNRLERDPNTIDRPHHHREHPMAYVPYPKWLHFEGEPSVLVANKDEHDAVMAAREEAATPKRGPGRKKTMDDLPPKVFELAPGDDPDEPVAEPEAPEAA